MPRTRRRHLRHDYPPWPRQISAGAMVRPGHGVRRAAQPRARPPSGRTARGAASTGPGGESKRGPSVWRVLFILVGMTGFEPATSSSRTTRATKLRHIPIRCFKSNFTRVSDHGPGCEIGCDISCACGSDIEPASAPSGPIRPVSPSRRRGGGRTRRRRQSAAGACRLRRRGRRAPRGPGPPSPRWKAGGR